MNSREKRFSRTLFFYIIRETLFSFFIAFLFFFFIFFINQLLLMAEEILSKRVPLTQVVLLIYYSLPAIVAMAAPFATLVGVLMAIGKMSSDNEILIILAGGLSYKSVYIPTLLTGLVISLFSFFANDVLLPAGTIEFGKLYRSILLTTPALELQSNSVKRFKDTVIVTGPVQKNTISDLLIFDRTGQGERRIITAEKAELGSQNSLSLNLSMSKSFIITLKENIPSDYDYAFSDFLSYSILQKNLTQNIALIGPREMSSTDVYREIQKKEIAQKALIDEKKRELNRQAFALEAQLRSGSQGLSWNQRSLSTDSFIKEENNFAESVFDRTLQLYRLEYYKKFSIPFGSLFFIFLALPLGLGAKKNGQSVGFGMGILIAVAYWGLLISGQTFGVRFGYSPFWAMWLPNGIVCIVGLVLSLFRISR
jgi:lipopolysaccharide export system permease protein